MFCVFWLFSFDYVLGFFDFWVEDILSQVFFNSAVLIIFNGNVFGTACIFILLLIALTLSLHLNHLPYIMKRHPSSPLFPERHLSPLVHEVLFIVFPFHELSLLFEAVIRDVFGVFVFHFIQDLLCELLFT